MRSLTSVVDALADETPDNRWMKIPAPCGDEDVWQDISWLQLRRAVDAMAFWMKDNLGPPMQDEPVAYMAVNDIRYAFAILAAMKTGYKVS